MSGARRHPAIAYNALKSAFRRLVDELGGIEAAAAGTRVGKSQISDYGAAHVARFAPVDVVIDMESLAGLPAVTEVLARAGGHELIRVDPHPAGDISARLHQLGADVARLFGDAALVLERGRARAAECDRLIGELATVRRDAAAAMAALGMIAGDEGERR